MTEFIIVVALIAVAAIGTYALFGESIRNQVAGLTMEVSGQDSGGQISQAQTNANDANDLANQEYNLSNYNEGAAQGDGSDSGTGID